MRSCQRHLIFNRVSGDKNGRGVTARRLEIYRRHIASMAMATSHFGLLDYLFYIPILLSIDIAATATALKGSLMVLVASTISQSRWMHFASSGVPLRDLEYIDDAARGPWGSLLWLLRLPRTSLLVTIGSCVTLVATAFSFFAQQFVAIDLRRVPDPEAVAYFPWVQDASIFDLSSIRAFSDGFLGVKPDDVLMSCPTGECTWNSVLSVGVCGTCLDATHRLEQASCANMQLSQHDRNYETILCNYTISGSRGNASNDRVVVAPAYNTSLKLPIVQHYGLSGVSPLPLVHIFGLGDSITYPKQTCNTSGLWTGSFGSFEVPLLNYDPDTHVLQFGSPTLTQCDLRFCLQNYAINIDHDQITQTLTNTTGFYCEVDQTPIFRDGVEGNKTPYPFAVSAPEVPFGVFFDQFREKPIILELDRGRKNASDAASYFQSAVDGLSEYHGPMTSSMSFLSAPGDYVAAWAQTKGNRPLWMDNLAQTINNAIRRANAVPMFRDSYAGTAYSEQAYIRISWSWIAYPASLVGVTLVLFAVSLITTHWTGRNVWMTGNLALLLSDVDENIRMRAQGAYGSHDILLDAIGRTEVHLVRDNDAGWIFRATDTY
ncbi:hypothetical protein TruAng_003246 [Truncatella angustata]|nr:hypothetical protein TruAng_003246 [Truncatella angustata]